MTRLPDIEIPGELAATQTKINGAAGRAFIEGLPGRAAEYLDRWDLTVTGPSMNGMAALVLPVVRSDGTPAALKMQIRDSESEHEWLALRLWDGAGTARLLDHDKDTATLLLERLDESRHLSDVEDSRAAVRILADLLARLTALPGPVGVRRLADIATDMLTGLPDALPRVPDLAARRIVADCGAAVREVLGEPGDRLLHWDLHYDNILAAAREPWLAIDPKPLVGDPGFDLLPALGNRYDEDEVLWRFDLMTDVLDLDRRRAAAWTLGRVLQNTLWDIQDGEPVQATQMRIGELLVAGRL
ncbi:aminoglycoside phosphotransferase family protein [Streptomyces sp. NPDC058001]|uniref:aminoglycoside phosphotransferase family protein n=1 Tax=Streptomyces sp. NPDC058001 TaxID=3346300 RepID=UPI0036E0D65B